VATRCPAAVLKKRWTHTLQTPVSLLERLRRQPDEPSWRRLDALYRPLIERWLRLDDSLGHEVEDLTQDVMQVIVREIPQFERERAGSFRRWVRIVTLNRLKDFWRRRRNRPKTTGGALQDSVLLQLEDPASELSQRWDREHDQYVLTRLLELIEPEFEPATWKAFRGVVIESRKALDVANDLAISPNAVLLAKSRILKRLREESKGLLD
jgi:RNA polymerase sigma-70 factor (ECF subfamily)